MQGQMNKLFEGMFPLNLADEATLYNWAEHWNITPKQLERASKKSRSYLVSDIQLALISLGYISPSSEDD